MALLHKMEVKTQKQKRKQSQNEEAQQQNKRKHVQEKQIEHTHTHKQHIQVEVRRSIKQLKRAKSPTEVKRLEEFIALQPFTVRLKFNFARHMKKKRGSIRTPSPV